MKRRVLSVLTAGALVLSFGATAFAAPASEPGTFYSAESDEIEGQGYLAAVDTYGPGGMIDVGFSENGFFWYANNDTAVDSAGNKVGDPAFDEDDIAYYELHSANYFIENYSEKINLAVSLVEYDNSTGGREEIETDGLRDDIVLNLTGALGAEGFEEYRINGDGELERFNIRKLGQNLFENDYTDPVTSAAVTGSTFRGTYTALLMNTEDAASESESRWTYSFDGYYMQDELPTDETTSDYLMELRFEIVGRETP